MNVKHINDHSLNSLYRCIQCAASIPNFIQRSIEIRLPQAHQTYVEDLVLLSVQWHHGISCRWLASRSTNETRRKNNAMGVDTRAPVSWGEIYGIRWLRKHNFVMITLFSSFFFLSFSDEIMLDYRTNLAFFL